MKNLTAAIYEKCSPGTDLYSAIGGRFYKCQAPQGAQFPYVIYFVVSNIPEYPGGKIIERILLQFSIFSAECGSTEVENILTYLRSLYDDCFLSIVNNTSIYFIRGNLTCMKEPADTISGINGVWHYSQEYDVEVVRS